MHGEREKGRRSINRNTNQDKEKGDGIVMISKKTSFRAGLSLSH